VYVGGFNFCGSRSLLPAMQWNWKQAITSTVPKSAHKHLLLPTYGLKMDAAFSSKY
jgi:hypothetical protein